MHSRTRRARRTTRPRFCRRRCLRAARHSRRRRCCATLRVETRTVANGARRTMRRVCPRTGGARRRVSTRETVAARKRVRAHRAAPVAPGCAESGAASARERARRRPLARRWSRGRGRRSGPARSSKALSSTGVADSRAGDLRRMLMWTARSRGGSATFPICAQRPGSAMPRSLGRHPIRYNRSDHTTGDWL
ncbi:hypothetical protein OKW43_001684 [Paraburkholderia sp. WC7.3g]